MGSDGPSRWEEAKRTRTAFADRFLHIAGLEATLQDTSGSSDLVCYDAGKDTIFLLEFYPSWSDRSKKPSYVDITYRRHIACTPVGAIAMSGLFGAVRQIATNHRLDFDIEWPVHPGHMEKGNVAIVKLKLRADYTEPAAPENTYKSAAEAIGLIHKTMQAYLAESTGK